MFDLLFAPRTRSINDRLVKLHPELIDQTVFWVHQRQLLGVCFQCRIFKRRIIKHKVIKSRGTLCRVDDAYV